MPHTLPPHSDLAYNFTMVKYTGDFTPKFNFLPLYFFHIIEFPLALKKRFTLLRAFQNSLFSIVLGCRLDDQEIFVQFPAETRVFLPLINVQTKYGCCPSSYLMGTKGSFSWG